MSHFAKMLIGLVFMAALGVGFLVAVNNYANRKPLAGIAPTVTQTTVQKSTQKTTSTSTQKKITSVSTKK